MTFFNAFVVGFAVTLGMEIALGLCFAIRAVLKGASKK